MLLTSMSRSRAQPEPGRTGEDLGPHLPGGTGLRIALDWDELRGLCGVVLSAKSFPCYLLRVNLIQKTHVHSSSLQNNRDTPELV